MNENILDILLHKQRILMEALDIGPNSGTLVSLGKASQGELGAVVGIVLEASEVLGEIEKANRKWKPSDIVVSAVKEELIDVVFFILELSVLLGLSGDDLTMIYEAKLKKNMRRLYRAVILGNTEMTESIQRAIDVLFTGEEIESMAIEFRREWKEAQHEFKAVGPKSS